ncbi:MAG: gliding motility-associated C-terminal domain-containing protein [Phaeodactylibacter sp.]|nr:gliding motility-associated C-terminal domain-containing protein [Phaeodactylibacter sp.]MCB9300497.1 gliding motility-associated C-terminal domain-containing protein [Lewinellaceae bacterium]
MKKILITLAVGLACTVAALAQPTINIVPPDGDPPCTGDQVCVDVVVADFTDILSTTFFIQWDPAVLQYNQTQGYNLPGLGGGNFTQTTDSTLLVQWVFGDCANPAANGYTISDGTSLFQVCFTALGQYGAASDIIIPATASPLTPDIKRKGAGCTNIGIEEENIDTALVSTCVRPFIVDISDELGNEGDLVCIDFRVSGFTDMLSFQFPVVWDSTKAEYVDHIVPGNLPNFNNNNIGTPLNAMGVEPGSITVSWSAPTPNNGVTVPDSTLVFQLCLRLKPGSCNMNFGVSIADEQPGQEFFQPEAANNFQNGFNQIAVGQFAGQISVGPCNPTGLQIQADCGAPVNLNDQICVKVLAGSNFQNVTTLQFLMEWNPAILSYTNTQNPGLPNGITFNAANAANGILGMSWSGNPTSRNAGDVLFEVCYDVTGLGGNSPFTFINQDNTLGVDVAIINNGGNIGINPTNCEVEVNQPDGVVINITDGLEGRPGDTLCYEFAVSNFNEVTSMQFSLAFEPAKFKYILAGGLQNLNLPGASAANFNFLGAGGGQIAFSNWNPASPVTLPDGSVIFTLCFEVVGDPGECDQLIVTDVPIVTNATTASSNGENVGLVGLGGNGCILSPEGFYLEGGNITGDIQDTACIPFVVSDFDGIISADFTLNWNPGAMELVEVQDLNQITGLNIDLVGQPVGSVAFDFNVPGGLTLADSTVVFNLCFQLLGPPDTCYAVTVSESPAPTVTTVNGDGSLLDIPGEACINDKLFIVDYIITPESCPGAGDGKAQVIVSGGVGQYIYSWQTQPPQFTPEARFLSEGFVVVTVLDQSAPPLSVTDTIYVPVLGADLFVNAGADKVSSCEPPCTFISPQASQGATITYNWTAAQGGQICSSPNDRVLLGRGPGLFSIKVTDQATGCYVTDTIRLLPPVLPAVEAGSEQTLTCAVNEVMLTASAQGDSVRYTWSDGGGTLAGPAVGPLSFMATDPGTYYLEATILTTGCTAMDSVVVVQDTIQPTAVASPGTDTTLLGCNDMATLVGFAGDNTDGLTFRWLDQNGTVVATTQDYMTNQTGVFTFEVTNNNNGCTNSDNTTVVPDSAVPVVEIQGGPSGIGFNCNGDDVELQAVVSNINPDAVSYLWTASGGAQIQPGTETEPLAVVTAPGTIGLQIISNLNGCEANSIIEVGFDTIPPVASIAMPGTLNCDIEQLTLDGSGSDQGGSYTYSWRYVEQNLDVDPNPGNPLQVDVALDGTYTLRVTDTLSGCFSIATVEVVRDTTPPVFDVIATSDINCLNSTVVVRANVDQPLGTYSVDWQALNGGNIVETTDTLIRVDAAGTYFATVTSLLTGCTDTLSRQVEAFLGQPEIVIPAEDRNLFLNCLSIQDTIDATGSTMSDSTTSIVYGWNVLQGSAIGGTDTYTLLVGEAGTFEFFVTNSQSLCTVRDTVVVEGNFDTPVANAGDNQTLVCSENNGQLDGSLSTSGPEIYYIWEIMENGQPVDTFAQGPNAAVVPVELPGLYRLKVINTVSGCSSVDFVQIDANGVPPQIVFGDPTNVGVLPFDCNSDTITVNLSILPDTLNFDNLNFAWDGDILTTNDPLVVRVYTPGVFTLTVTDTSNGCDGTNELVVEDLRVLPTAQVVNETSIIDCDTDVVTLDGAGSSSGVNFLYEWTDPNDGAIGDALQVDVMTPGEYKLLVTDTTNGCTATAIATVTEDRLPPAITFEEAPAFQCRDNSLDISAAPSGNAADFSTIQWTPVAGGQVSGNAGTLTASVDGPGAYQLTLVSALNGCDSTATIEVAADTIAPNIQLELPAMFGCAGQTVSIDASLTGAPGDFESINWTPGSGSGNVTPASGSLLVDVDGAGTYQLTVVSADNGCEASTEVTVEQDPNTPSALATASDNIISCGENITLDGSQSSQGSVFSFQWVVLSGTGTVSTPDAATATVNAAGAYQLIVTNTDNNCADTSAVLAIELDPSLVSASAVQNEAACGLEASVTGNGGALPAGVSGQWIPVGAVSVADNTSPTTTVGNLLQGANLIVWSLSQDGCPNYSSDTLSIVPEQAPVANNDILTIPEGDVLATLNLAANDVLDGVSEFTISIVNNPALGDLADDGNGDYTYSLLTNLFQPAGDEFTYRICNALCPELCDEALVQVMIERDTTLELELPNAITPNGDGLNDALIFDQLLLNPDKFPDNELIIFNRWGDIVYKAKPYTNDWQGVNMSGEDLPDGTYYYILRLVIGSGEIIRGDVTILK